MQEESSMTWSLVAGYADVEFAGDDIDVRKITAMLCMSLLRMQSM